MLYYIIIILIVVLCLIVTMRMTGWTMEGFSGGIEGFDCNSQAIQNISSVYNKEHLIVDQLSATKFNMLPVGSIIMWGKGPDNIPEGWAVCDGQNGTPNLRDRFILGSGDSSTTKGDGNINLTPFNSEKEGEHFHGYDGVRDCGGATNKGGYQRCVDHRHKTTKSGIHEHKINLNATELGLKNLKPKYHTLIFIMRVV